MSATSFGSQYAILESQCTPNGNNQNYQAITTCISGLIVGSSYTITCSISTAAASTGGVAYSPNDFFVTFNGIQVYYTSSVINPTFYAITTAPFVATSTSGILSLGVTNPNYYADAITLVDNVVLNTITPLTINNSGSTQSIATNMDPYAGNVILLLHFDGNASTGSSVSSSMFTDSSPLNNIITINGNPLIVTIPAQKYGSASISVAANNYLRTAASPIFTLGMVDFTVEMYVYFNTTQLTNGAFCGNVGSATANVSFGYGNWSFGFTGISTTTGPFYLALFCYNAINGTLPVMTGVTSITTSTWHHVALCRYGNTFYMYLDGILQGTLAGSSAGLFGMSIDSPAGIPGANILPQSFAQIPQSISVGSDGSASGANCFSGYIDEFRMTKGIARYVPCQFYALDTLSPSAIYSATGFYDIKRLLTVYTGATLNLRGNTDATGTNATDFYADQNGNLGTALNAGGTSLYSWMKTNGYTSLYVTKWYDQSGKTNNATQATVSLQPLYDVGYKRIVFNGTSTYLSIPAGVVATSGAYFISAKHGDIGSGNAIVGVGNSTANNYLRATINGGTEASGLYCNSWNNTTPSTSIFGTGVAGSGNNYWINFTTLSVKYDNAYTSTGYINGKFQSIYSTATGLSVTTPSQTGTIGVSQAGGSLNSYLNGQLYALSLFTSALNDQDRLILEQVFPLDTLSQSAASSMNAVFAPIRTLASYTGPMFRIRGDLDIACVNYCDFFADISGNLGTTLNAGGVSLSEWMMAFGYSTPYIMIWYDQSGQGAHATQSAPSQQPTYDILNKQVTFNGTSQYFMLPNYTVPYNDNSYTFVVRHGVVTLVGGGFQVAIYAAAGSANGTVNGLGICPSNTTYIVYYQSWWNNIDTTTTSGYYANGATVTLRYLGGTSGLRVFNVNGQIVTNATNGSGTRTSPIGPASIGAAASASGTTNLYYSGNMAFICIFNSAINDSDRIIAENIIPPLPLSSDFPAVSTSGALIPSGYPQAVLASGISYYTYGLTTSAICNASATTRNNAPVLYTRVPGSLNWTIQADITIPVTTANVYGTLLVYTDYDNTPIPFYVGLYYTTSYLAVFQITSAGSTSSNTYSGSGTSYTSAAITPGTAGLVTFQLTKNGNYYYAQYSTNQGFSWTGINGYFTFTTPPAYLRLGFLQSTSVATSLTTYYRNLAITYNYTQLTQVARGGTMFIQNIGGIPYVFHVFSQVGTLSFVLNYARSIDILVVAGGGGGGGSANSATGGGGGGGGVLYFQQNSLSAGTYTITVGGGGAVQTNGGNSQFGSLTACVGGGYGNGPGGGNTGGSGGGGGNNNSIASSGGAGTAGPPIQGYAGGANYTASPSYAGGGGGGAGGIGINGSSTSGGNGGVGLQCFITGSSVYYGGGGGGGTDGRTTGLLQSTGGLGGGANGAYNITGVSNAGGNGMPNTGGGGGGCSYTNSGGIAGYGGLGGSGIVIVRYPAQISAPFGSIPNSNFGVIYPITATSGNAVATGSSTYCSSLIIPGWTFTGNCLILAGTYATSWTTINPPCGNIGNYVLGIQSSSTTNYGVATTTIIGLSPGNSYKITCWVINRGVSVTTIQTLTITVAGTIVYQQAIRSTTNYYQISTNIFTISSGTTASLVVSGVNTATDQTCFISNLQLVNVTGQTQPAYTTNNLLAYWDFAVTNSYPGSGYYVYDLSGNNMTLTWNTLPTYNASGAISVTTTNSQAASMSTILNLTSGYTYECMVYYTSYTSQPILIRFNGGSGYFQIQGSGNQYVMNGMSAGNFGTLQTIANNVWYHIIITWLNSTTVQIYINGISQTVFYNTSPSVSFGGTAQTLALGDSSGTIGLAGNYAMARVYNAALTQAQIYANYYAVYSNLPNNPYNLPNVATNSAFGGNSLSTIYVNVNGVSTKYYVHFFTSTGTSTFAMNASSKVCDILVIGGGGAGSCWAGAGGGAGGIVLVQSQSITTGTFTITVGAGGLGQNSYGLPGANSTFTNGTITITAYGGGGGWHAGTDNTPNNASGNGSGGGGPNTTPFTGGTASKGTTTGVSGSVSLYGNAGGNGYTGSSGGGGGGAGAVGSAATSTTAGNGGIGYADTMFNSTLTYYSGGGGGTNTYSTTPIASGGLGGGGAGSTTGGGGVGTAGTANTGGGGGGGGNSGSGQFGGAGGSGIVIIRYPA